MSTTGQAEPRQLTINIDGASRGNPGPAAFAYSIQPAGGHPVEAACRLGDTTNNIAEYTALVKALERAAEFAPAKLLIYSDSELLVKQMNGEYKVKNPGLQDLFDEAKGLARRFASVTIRHVLRGQNKRADELCNLALDGKPITPPARPAGSSPGPGSGVTPATGAKSPKKSAPGSRPGAAQAGVPASREDAARVEAVECLTAAAKAWARGDAANPSAEVVWEQLLSILDENGLLARKPTRG